MNHSWWRDITELVCSLFISSQHFYRRLTNNRGLSDSGSTTNGGTQTSVPSAPQALQKGVCDRKLFETWHGAKTRPNLMRIVLHHEFTYWHTSLVTECSLTWGFIRFKWAVSPVSLCWDVTWSSLLLTTGFTTQENIMSDIWRGQEHISEGTLLKCLSCSLHFLCHYRSWCELINLTHLLYQRGAKNAASCLLVYTWLDMKTRTV